MSFNIDSLFEQQNKLKILKIKSYETILNIIILRIKKYSSLKQTSFLYDIPSIINSSNLLINKHECALFIIKKLINMKFSVKMIRYKKTGIVRLYISWNDFLKSYVYNTQDNEHNNKKIKNHYNKLNKQLLNDF